MLPSFRRRQVLTAALVAIALRPPANYWLGAPAMIVGWLTSELAPQLLVATAVDGARELSTNRGDRVGLGVAAASAAGLALLIREGTKTGDVVDRVLCEGLGQDYRSRTPRDDVAPDLGTPWQQLAFPFVVRDADVEVIRDLPYDDHPKTRLDVYRCRSGVLPNAPVLVHVHGGAWMTGNKSFEGTPLMLHMAKRGWLCVNVDYRLAPQDPFPAQIIDVKRALAWVREHAAGYGADASHIAISGGSAGGHLAALAALTPGLAAYQPGFEDADTSVQAAVPHYGIYDFAAEAGTVKALRRRDRFLAPWVLNKDPVADRADFERASPLHHVHPDAPPFFVIHGADDTGVEVAEAQHFVRRLRTVSRNPVAYAELPGAQHAFDIFPSIRSAQLLRGVERFLGFTAPTRRDAVSGTRGAASPDRCHDRR